MKRILDRNIKEIIAQSPDVAGILAGYGIGCTTCSVGTCRLKDIVEMHSLTQENERSLFEKIASVVFPGEKVEMPQPSRKPGASPAKKLSPVMELLIDEHRHIKKVLAAIPDLAKALESDLDSKRDLIREVVAFVRNYADSFHHAKEEDILFVQFIPQTEIIASMRKEHDIGRAHIKAVLTGLDEDDATAITDHLVQYAGLLKEHIRKEDEILYPWMDRNLTDSQIGRMYSQCCEVSQAFGDAPARLVEFAANISAQA